MAVPVARVHLAMAHAALPALLPTPPKWKMMMPLITPPPHFAILPKSPPKKPGRADSDERWDAHKIKPAASPASSSSAGASTVSSCKIGKAPPSKPGRADSVESWDAHKKPANAPGALPDQHSSNRASSMSRAAALSAAHKNPPPPPPHAKTSRCIAAADDDSSTGSNDRTEMEMAQSLLRRVLHAGPSFVAAPEPCMLPMPTSFIRAAKA